VSESTCVLVCADSFVAPELDPLPHAIITDPPYNIGKWGENWETEKRSASQQVGLRASGQNFRPQQYGEQAKFTKRWAMRHTTVPGGFVVVFSAARLSGAVMTGMAAAGLLIRDMFVWHPGMGQMKAQSIARYAPDVDMEGRKTPQFAPCIEAIIVAQTPLDGNMVDNWTRHRTGLVEASYPSGRARSQMLSYPRPSRAERVGHPTQKPVELMVDLVERFTLPGQMVLDPFAGSGTTLVAARSCGRDSYGFERDTGYHQMALARLGQS
jgi:site-specific DNA-methyltransferase (adenine-specific)